MWDSINKSKRSSIILLLSFVVFSILTILVIGIYLMYSFGTVFGAVFIFGLSFYVIFHSLRAYRNSSEIALKSVNAIPLDETNYPLSKKQFVKDTVESLAIAAGIPTPRVYVMDSPMINAFATGKDPEHSVICLTTGAINKLNREELEGVVGHEMGHILNGDIAYMTFASILLAFLVTLSGIGIRMMFFSRGDRRDSGAIIILGILLAILAPILGKLFQSAISRQREFLADATSAKLTRDPNELISALRKIEMENEKKIQIPSKVVALMIWEPKSLFATHPPIEERIKRLQKMM